MSTEPLPTIRDLRTTATDPAAEAVRRLAVENERLRGELVTATSAIQAKEAQRLTAAAMANWLAEDFRSADKGDHAAKIRIDAHIKTLCAADPKKNYVAHMREARTAALAR